MNFNIGDRCRVDSNVSSAENCGTITEIYTKPLNALSSWQTYHTECEVKLDNGNSKRCQIRYLLPEDTEESLKLRENIETVQKSISEHLKNAEKSINEAISIAEKECIPFYSKISEISQKYCISLSRIENKYSNIDTELLKDIFEISDYYDDGTGWQHSAVC